MLLIWSKARPDKWVWHRAVYGFDVLIYTLLDGKVLGGKIPVQLSNCSHGQHAKLQNMLLSGAGSVHNGIVAPLRSIYLISYIAYMIRSCYSECPRKAVAIRSSSDWLSSKATVVPSDKSGAESSALNKAEMVSWTISLNQFCSLFSTSPAKISRCHCSHKLRAVYGSF